MWKCKTTHTNTLRITKMNACEVSVWELQSSWKWKLNQFMLKAFKSLMHIKRYDWSNMQITCTKYKLVEDIKIKGSQVVWH